MESTRRKTVGVEEQNPLEEINQISEDLNEVSDTNVELTEMETKEIKTENQEAKDKIIENVVKKIKSTKKNLVEIISEKIEFIIKAYPNLEVSIYDRTEDGLLGLILKDKIKNQEYFFQENFFSNQDIIRMRLENIVGDIQSISKLISNNLFVFNPTRNIGSIIDLKNQIIYEIPFKLISTLSVEIQQLISNKNREEISLSILSESKWDDIFEKINKFLETYK